jgi:N-acetylmuramoyl-L-alanine amidase
MRRISRAAALSAAALLFCAAAGLASPANAQRADAIAGHQGSSLSAQSLGVDDATDPATPGDEEPQAPVVTHAIANIVPQNLLDQQPGDNGTSARGGRGLADLVGDYESADTPDEETDCLARAVYWESKGEPLIGQLAVADVIINRAQSGRFASTICGVVRQRSQFSFVHGGYIPPAPQGSPQWHTAVAIARIARQDLAADAAPQALFFHARYVHPGWRLTRVASVGNHVFYR